jgi:hypothetical protein
MATISTRIAIEGGDEIRRQLQDLGKAVEAAFKQIAAIADAAKIDPATQQSFDDLAEAGKKLGAQFGDLADAAKATTEPIQASGEAADKAAEAFGSLGDASGKAAENLNATGDAAKKSGEAAESAHESYAKFALEVVKVGVSAASVGSSIASAGTVTVGLSAQVVTAAAAVGTFAVTLGTVVVPAIAAAVAGLGQLGAAWATADAKMSDALTHLATNARNIGQDFTSLQVGQDAFAQLGISGEKFRGVVAGIASQLASFKPNEAIAASAKAIVDATNSVVEAEKRLREAQIASQGGDAASDARVQALAAMIEQAKKVGEVAAAEKGLADARKKQASEAANDLGKIVERIQQIEAGTKAIAAGPLAPGQKKIELFGFDDLVKTETIIEAIKVRLSDLTKIGGDAAKSLANIIANLPKPEAFAVGKAFGLSDTDVDRIRRYGTEAGKIDDLFVKIRGAGVLIGPQTAQTFDEMAESSQRLASAWARLQQAWASTVFSDIGAQIATAFNTAAAAIVEGMSAALETVNTLFSQIAQGWGQIFSGAGKALVSVFEEDAARMKGVIDAIGGWLSTPTDGAFQWISAAFNTALDGIKTATAPITQFITDWVTTPVANAWQWLVDAFNSVLGAIKSAITSLYQPSGGGSGDGSGFAGGGLLGGRGTGTSDSNLAWVSRGEYITPAGAVSQPGVLAFLEALRRTGGDLRAVLDGMGRFAVGGLVGPIALPAMAAASPRNLGTLTLHLPDGTAVTGLTDERIAEALGRFAAKSQIRSGGRKPSRYR